MASAGSCHRAKHKWTAFARHLHETPTTGYRETVRLVVLLCDLLLFKLLLGCLEWERREGTHRTIDTFSPPVTGGQVVRLIEILQLLLLLLLILLPLWHNTHETRVFFFSLLTLLCCCFSIIFCVRRTHTRTRHRAQSLQHKPQLLFVPDFFRLCVFNLVTIFYKHVCEFFFVVYMYIGINFY